VSVSFPVHRSESSYDATDTEKALLDTLRMKYAGFWMTCKHKNKTRGYFSQPFGFIRKLVVTDFSFLRSEPQDES
jgi:hypothetical protein